MSFITIILDIVKIKWTKVADITSDVLKHTSVYLPRHYECQGYRSKLVQLYGNSSLYARVLRKVVVFGSCLLHVGTYGYRVMLCYAMLCWCLTACFACGNSTFLKDLKIELWCVRVRVCVCMCVVCVWCVCVCVQYQPVLLYRTVIHTHTHTPHTHTHTYTHIHTPHTHPHTPHTHTHTPHTHTTHTTHTHTRTHHTHPTHTHTHTHTPHTHIIIFS